MLRLGRRVGASVLPFLQGRLVTLHGARVALSSIGLHRVDGPGRRLEHGRLQDGRIAHDRAPEARVLGPRVVVLLRLDGPVIADDAGQSDQRRQRHGRRVHAHAFCPVEHEVCDRIRDMGAA